MSDPASNPCITCGACCGHYRVSFHWSESDASLGGTVPPELTEKLNEHRVAMKGTHCKQPRCIALQGAIGSLVHCNIYSQRSSACREFAYAWENGIPHERCDQARAAYGLPPLLPQAIIFPAQPSPAIAATPPNLKNLSVNELLDIPGSATASDAMPFRHN